MAVDKFENGKWYVIPAIPALELQGKGSGWVDEMACLVQVPFRAEKFENDGTLGEVEITDSFGSNWLINPAWAILDGATFPVADTPNPWLDPATRSIPLTYAERELLAALAEDVADVSDPRNTGRFQMLGLSLIRAVLLPVAKKLREVK